MSSMSSINLKWLACISVAASISTSLPSHSAYVPPTSAFPVDTTKGCNPLLPDRWCILLPSPPNDQPADKNAFVFLWDPTGSGTYSKRSAWVFPPSPPNQTDFSNLGNPIVNPLPGDPGPGSGVGFWTDALFKQLDQSKFGNLNQRTIDCPVAGLSRPNYACGPVAATNSFQWLENAYPKVYDNKLIPVSLEDTANKLKSSDYMDTECGPTCPPLESLGTYLGDFIYGKQKWIEEKVPGVTVYDAVVVSWDTRDPGRSKPDYVKFGKPNFKFLYNNLLDGEDIEILINQLPCNLLDQRGCKGANHYLTVTSIYLEDSATKNGDIDLGEYGFIDYIDPWTGLPGGSDFYLGSDGFLELDYSKDLVPDSYIVGQVKESPVRVPGPLSISGLFIALNSLRRLRVLSGSLRRELK